MLVNSRLKATQIIGQKKAFHRQRISESSCVRKETVDIDILVTSRNGDRKIMQSIRITSRQVEPVLMNIYQSNTYRKDLSWPHFDDEPKVQEKQNLETALHGSLVINEASKYHINTLWNQLKDSNLTSIIQETTKLFVKFLKGCAIKTLKLK